MLEHPQCNRYIGQGLNDSLTFESFIIGSFLSVFNVVLLLQLQFYYRKYSFIVGNAVSLLEISFYCKNAVLLQFYC
jgi:hypothetical protein